MVNKSLVPPLAALLLLVVALALVAGSVGAGATSDVIVQACTEPPATPKQTAPPNGSTVTGSSVTLQWSAVEGATTYRLQLCGDAACSEYVGDFTTQNTSFNVPGLDTFLPEGSCVYWQVRAENDCGVSDYSPLWEICRPAPTATPTDTPGTPTATYTPGTPTATYTPGTATRTPTRTRTPTPSNTVTGSNIYGYVRDVDTDAPLQGVTISLYRGGAGNWALVNEKTTDANGYFAFSFSSVPTLHQLVESDPAGYQSDRVTFPSGFAATVVDANTVEFNPPATSTGPIIFYDKVMPTATPTNTPTNTATPTATNTPTPTPTITLTPTLSDGLTVWLPMIVNVFER